MGSVHYLENQLETTEAREPGEPPAFDGGGGGGDNGSMEARVTTLEATLPHLATRADIADVRGDIQRGISETHKWMIATVIGLFLGFGGLFLAMSNALKPAGTTVSASPPAPIVINIPAQQAPAPK